MRRPDTPLPPLRRRALLLRALGPACLPARAAAAAAPSWPRGPVRQTLAYPPGGASDEVARAMAERLAVALGVPVRLDYVPGAGGAVALEALTHTAPDGQALCFCAINPLTVMPHLSPQRYALLRGVVPVAAVMATPALVAGTPALAARGFKAMIDDARRAPAHLRWATSGVATTGHLLLEQVRRASGVDITHVPYKGGGQQISDALAGHFEVLSSNVAGLQLELVAQRRLTALAVGASARLSVLPHTPTLAELGYPAANLSSVFAIFAPPLTPPPLVQRLNRLIDTAVREPVLLQRLISAGNEALGGTPAELVERIEHESAQHRELLQANPEAFRS